MAGAAAAGLALPSLARGGFVAFAAPDFAQTRKLHDELLALAEPDLVAHGLALQFAPMPQNNEPLLAERMKELVARRPALIFAASERITVEARRWAPDTPIIFATHADPVRTGIVASLSRPGGNLTGFSYDVEIERKQLEPRRSAWGSRCRPRS